MATKNRRRYLRTKASNLVAHFKFNDKSVMAAVEDISMGGAFLKTSEAVPHGTLLAFDVARPGLKRPLRLNALVVDARHPRGLGLRFNALDTETMERLSELMRDLGGVVSTAKLEDPTDVRLSINPTIQHGGGGAPGGIPHISVGHATPPLGARPAAPMAGGAGVGPPRTSSSTFPAPVPTGAFAAGQQQNAQPDELSKLMLQLRGAIMEIGKLQEQVVQRDRELSDLRSQIGGAGADRRGRDAAEGLVGKLEMEKMRLEEQLAVERGRSRADMEVIKREAEVVLSAMGRLVEALKRLG